MGEVRLYAVGIAEVRDIVGAPEDHVDHLRDVAHRAFTSAPAPAPRGLLGKLGPIFRRDPAAPVVRPTDPEPRDVDVLLAGAHVSPDRAGATWRVLETLVCDRAWASTRMELTSAGLDALDFALARAGVTSAVGLRHLLETSTGLTLLPVRGLVVGYHRYEQAVAMAGTFRGALAQLDDEHQRDMVRALASWLDGFVHWGSLAPAHGRPVPDLVGFWVQ